MVTEKKKKVKKSNKKVVVKRNVVYLLVKYRSDEIISDANVLKVFAFIYGVFGLDDDLRLCFFSSKNIYFRT